MILALVREVPVQIPDEPASLFGYSFLEQYPSILPSLANRTPLSKGSRETFLDSILILAGQLLFSVPPSEFYTAKRREDDQAAAWFHGVTGYDSRLVREVRVQIPDEPTCTFEEWPLTLIYLAHLHSIVRGEQGDLLETILILAGWLRFSEPPSEFYTAKRREDDPVSAWFHGVTVSTLDSESSDPSSNLGGTCWLLTGSARKEDPTPQPSLWQRV
ncbi:hypothetical protein G5714_011595 [Onychostoma macrolepis]|uniref:Uncharacterized protein n=1 Tax=Onychostoma macrolepis TaxID=369639 RepID=A0A7J6CJ97_9TELE|nr:hypothetical protein G5714_011595 [Onychostoma macrolepis]